MTEDMAIEICADVGDDVEVVLHCVAGQIGAMKKTRSYLVMNHPVDIKNKIDHLLASGFQGNIRIFGIDEYSVKIITEEKIGRQLLTEE